MSLNTDLSDGDGVVGAEIFLGVDAGDFAYFAAAVDAGQERSMA
jgi:hypothetical protein